ncbi:MAG: hypothetical protein H7301_03245 [Cryobacterium sp.]|nr:hypothetical protein [Oligoflexia bacterium]
MNGESELTLNNHVLKLQAAVYVSTPLRSKRRISNPTKDTIHFVEMQVGTYFGEADITRVQDDYRRGLPAFSLKKIARNEGGCA